MRGTIFSKKMKIKTRLDTQNPGTRMVLERERERYSLKGKNSNHPNKCSHIKLSNFKKIKNNAIIAFINHTIKRRENSKPEILVFLRI